MGFGVLSLRFGVWGLGSGVWLFWFLGLWGLGLVVWGSGCGVWVVGLPESMKIATARPEAGDVKIVSLLRTRKIEKSYLYSLVGLICVNLRFRGRFFPRVDRISEMYLGFGVWGLGLPESMRIAAARPEAVDVKIVSLFRTRKIDIVIFLSSN